MNLISALALFLFVSCRTLGNISLPAYVGSPSYSDSSSSNSNSNLWRGNSQDKGIYHPRVTTRQAYEVEGCKSRGSMTSSSKDKEALQKEADRLGAGSLVFEETPESMTAHYYDCSEKFSQYSELIPDRNSISDFSLFAGRYIQRDGILKKLGRMGPTLGVEFSKFADQESHHGFFLTWTFDHFWKTNGSLLRPDFDDQDYTNYMAGGGYAFRYVLHERLQFHYRGGLAFNFIEIDTFRANGDPDDGKHSDITVSTIHRTSLDYTLRRAKYDKGAIRAGPTLFYYWAPDPLGKFRLTNEKSSKTPGGSLSLMLNLVFEIN